MQERAEFRLGLDIGGAGLFGKRDKNPVRVINVYIRKPAFFSGGEYTFDFSAAAAVPIESFLSTPTFDSRLSELAEAIAKILTSLKSNSMLTLLEEVTSFPPAFNSPDKKTNPPVTSWNNLPTEAGLVFICYSHDDKTFAHDLANTLKTRGLRVWVDAWEITAGADWRSSVDKGLAKCDSLLILLSPSSLDEKDENVPEALREVYMAMDMRKPIVPLLYRSCEIPPRLKLIHHIDFRSASLDDEDLIGKLLRDIRAAKK